MTEKSKTLSIEMSISFSWLGRAKINNSLKRTSQQKHTNVLNASKTAVKKKILRIELNSIWDFRTASNGNWKPRTPITRVLPRHSRNVFSCRARIIVFVSLVFEENALDPYEKMEIAETCLEINEILVAFKTDVRGEISRLF